ncbi:MAG: hypothetical protein ACJAWS_001242 [Oleiphilaceae bacterium]|jgi:hypothetical protein
MNKIIAVFISLCFSLSANAYVVNTNNFQFGSSWDNPNSNVNTILTGLEDETGSGLTLNMISAQTWNGIGVSSIILEELAGYKHNTTFGWYNTATNDSEQIFSGADGKGANAAVNFGSLTDIGFYIDPNGITNNRMYTESHRNTHSDIQVAIFKIEELENSYILGWEDLDLNGGTGGDRDYQDMIVRITIAQVPEPGSMALLGLGLLGLIVTRKKTMTA